MRRNRRIKINKFGLLVLLLLISIGFALLSTTLKIDGLFGIKGNSWDIHWENVQPNTNSSVTTDKPSIDTTRTIVTYDVALELPGDYYEFDVDAKNDGSVAGTITDVRHSARKVVEEGQDSTVPDYIKYSVVYKGTNINPSIGDVLASGEKQTYTIRVEYDSNATEVPEEDMTIRFEDEIDYGQLDTRGKYKITFDSNGGTAYPTVKYIEQGESIGSLAQAKKENEVFTGWKTITGDTITGAYIPDNDMTIIAQWTNSYATFKPGTDVITSFKRLAGNDMSGSNSYSVTDTYITSIVRSDTAPASGTTTEVVSVDGSTPIVAWFDNGTINIYSEANYLVLNENAGAMFNGLTNATSIYTNYITSNTTEMGGMFSNTKADNLNLSSFDTSKVTNMAGMFSGSQIDNINLSNFDTSNVTSMASMFAGSRAQNVDVSNFNTPKLTNMAGMFSGCSNLTNLDLSSFDVSKVTSFGGLVSGSGVKNLNISNWNFDSVTSLSALFASVSNLETINLTNVNTSKITDMSAMFASCTNLKSVDLSSFDTSKVTSMASMFAGDSSLKKLDLSNFDVSKVTNFGGMFSGMSSLEELDISNWNFASTTSLSYFFSYGLTKLEKINLKNVKTSEITDMSAMFNGCSNIKKLDLSSFDTSKVTNMSGMLGNMTKLEELDISNWNFSNYGPSSLMMNMSNGGFSSLKTFILDNVVFPANMIYGLGGLSTVEVMSLENVDTSNVTDMSSMFNGCSKLNGLTLKSFETSNVTNMNAMFLGCSKLKKLNLGSFDTSNVTNMGSMFEGCTELTTISVSDDFVVDQVTMSDTMFSGDTKLVGGHGTVYDSDHIDKEYAHYDGGENDPGYFNRTEIAVMYTVTFNPDGGSVNPTTKEVEDGTFIGELPVPTKNGASYTGWYTEDGKNITTRTRVESDVTYYAHWIDNKEVIYNANGGTFKNKNTKSIIYKYNINTGKYSGTGYTIPTKEGYKFIGWDTSNQENGYVYKSENEIIEDLDDFTTPKTLYAKWKKVNTVTFNPNGGTVTPKTKSIEDGEAIGQLPTPTGTSPFLGWYTEVNGGVRIDASTIPTGNTTYYAHWATTYTTFDTGENVNIKIKTLAGTTKQNGDAPDKDTADTTVTVIARANAAPAQGTTTVDLSAPGSNYPITAWSTGNGVIVYYTEADNIFLNQDASYMFHEFENLLDLSTPFYTSNTTDMNHMFSYCNSLPALDVSTFNTSKVTDMSYMFFHMSTIYSLDLSNFDTSNVTNMEYMILDDNNVVTFNLSNFNFRKYNVKSLISKLGLYSRNNSLKNVILDNAVFQQNMEQCFFNSNFEYLSLKNVDTSAATTMHEAFAWDDNIKKLDLSSFDTSNVTDMSYMFQFDGNLEEINFSSFDTSKVTNMEEMFWECTSLKSLDLSNFDTSSITIDQNDLGGMLYMFDTTHLEYLNLSNMDLSFYTGNSKGDLSQYLMGEDTSIKKSLKYLIMDNVKFPAYMSYAFYDFQVLEYLSLRNVDTSAATVMLDLFYDDYKLKELDLSSFDTSHVTDMYSMFGNMNELTTIIVGDGFKILPSTRTDSMFYRDTKLVGEKGTTYDSNYQDKTYARYDGGQDNPGYFTKPVSKEYRIKFNANGGVTDSKVLYVRKNSTIPFLLEPTREGYTFVGWFTSPTDGIKITESYTPNSNMTLYARWTPNN